MEMCKADAAEAERNYETLDEADDDEPSWGPLRQTIAFALTDMMRGKSLPYALRARVFQIIEAIIADRDPTPDQDDRYSGRESHGDPWSLALNSARGAGMLALFEYARWINAALKGDEGEFDLRPHAPELFSLLDRMLDPMVEHTRAIRSTYGQNFVSIYAESRTWTKGALDRIFTNDDAGRASWEAYLVFNRIYGETFDVLRSRYERHAFSIGEEPNVDRTDWYPAGSLGSHFLGPYLWGRLDLQQGPLAAFLHDAPPSALSHMMTSAGNALNSPNWSDETMHRFEVLFERMLELYSDRTLEERRKILAIFGLWFISDNVDPRWALSMLQAVLHSTAGQVNMEWRVIEKLGVFERDASAGGRYGTGSAGEEADAVSVHESGRCTRNLSKCSRSWGRSGKNGSARQ